LADFRRTTRTGLGVRSLLPNLINSPPRGWPGIAAAIVGFACFGGGPEAEAEAASEAALVAVFQDLLGARKCVVTSLKPARFSCVSFLKLRSPPQLLRPPPLCNTATNVDRRVLVQDPRAQNCEPIEGTRGHGSHRARAVPRLH